MGNTDLIIHKPNEPLTMSNEEVIKAVVAAAEEPLIPDDQLEQLRTNILEENQDLIEEGVFYPDQTGLRGNRCLVVDVQDHVLNLVVQRLSRIAPDMGLAVVSELDDLVLAYGDDTSEMFIRTVDWETAWASPRALRQWLSRVTEEMMYFHDHGSKAVDFLIVGESRAEQRYIQAIYLPAEGAYQVEMRKGGPEAHYQTMIEGLDETIAAFETWMDTRERTPQADWQRIEE